MSHRSVNYAQQPPLHGYSNGNTNTSGGDIDLSSVQPKRLTLNERFTLLMQQPSHSQSASYNSVNNASNDVFTNYQPTFNDTPNAAAPNRQQPPKHIKTEFSVHIPESQQSQQHSQSTRQPKQHKSNGGDKRHHTNISTAPTPAASTRSNTALDDSILSDSAESSASALHRATATAESKQSQSPSKETRRNMVVLKRKQNVLPSDEKHQSLPIGQSFKQRTQSTSTAIDSDDTTASSSNKKQKLQITTKKHLNENENNNNEDKKGNIKADKHVITTKSQKQLQHEKQRHQSNDQPLFKAQPAVNKKQQQFHAKTKQPVAPQQAERQHQRKPPSAGQPATAQAKNKPPQHPKPSSPSKQQRSKHRSVSADQLDREMDSYRLSR